MQLEISPELAELRTALRRFTTDKLEPIALEIDRTGEVPQQAFDALRTQGYLGLRLPSELGGSGMDLSAFCLAQEEFSRSHRMFSLILEGSTGFLPIAITRFGTDEQIKKYVPALAAGKMVSAFALTEPGAGSDSQAITTRAERREGGWLLNGRKHYISGAHKADVTLVMAVNDAQKRARGGISSFLVDRDTPGFLVTRVDTTMGSDTIKLAELTFEDCFVPDGAVLGEVGQGFKIAMDSLVSGGMGIVKGYPVERFYRDVRHYRIGEGSSEVQRMLIAREVLR